MSDTRLSELSERRKEEEEDDAERADGGQTRQDRSLQILNEKKQRVSEELTASHNEGEPLEEKDKRLVAELMAIDKLLELNKDKSDVPAQPGARRGLIRRDRVGDEASIAARRQAVASAGTTTTTTTTSTSNRKDDPGAQRPPGRLSLSRHPVRRLPPPPRRHRLRIVRTIRALRRPPGRLSLSRHPVRRLPPPPRRHRLRIVRTIRALRHPRGPASRGAKRKRKKRGQD